MRLQCFSHSRVRSTWPLRRAVTASPKPSFTAPWRVGNAVVSRGNAGWTTSKSGLSCSCQNCSQGSPAEEAGRGSLLNRLSCPLRQPNWSRDWTELNWLSVDKGLCLLVTRYLLKLRNGRSTENISSDKIRQKLYTKKKKKQTNKQTKLKLKRKGEEKKKPWKSCLFHLNC